MQTELQPLLKLLEIPLDTENGAVMSKQIAEVEKYQTRVSMFYREAEHDLSVKKAKLIDPNLSSEDKRKVDLAGKVAQEQMTVDEFADLSKTIQTRISLGQSLLKNFSIEARSGLR